MAKLKQKNDRQHRANTKKYISPFQNTKNSKKLSKNVIQSMPCFYFISGTVLTSKVMRLVAICKNISLRNDSQILAKHLATLLGVPCYA